MTIEAELPSRPPAAVEGAAYFVVTETLANATKHSGARAVLVRLALRDGTFVKFGEETGPVEMPDYGAFRFTRVAGPTPEAPDVYSPLQAGWVAPSEVPTGWAVFNTHPLMRRIMDPQGKVAHWSEFESGGHFPAMEQPELLADDIRKFFRGLR